MFKKFSVLILAVIQVVFCIGITAVKPAENRLIENFGKDYYLEVDSIKYTDDWGPIHFDFYLKCDWRIPRDYINYLNIFEGEYGILETDENGISHLSEYSLSKPKKADYIKGAFRLGGGWSTDLMPTEKITDILSELKIPYLNLADPIPEYSNEHIITLKVRIYKGLYQIKGLCVDGVPIENILEK